ncbi:PQQ-dependent sugar dehydrogenase [Nocardioides sp. STR2]|uniref:PQQ-dependent sugar dehydrogenase n=1 Tax=Nocardioides pini TaxID=2975053 RepID=A0ABT4CDZ0_9ACTN|nr:PQQ-dependent sugar dehydrogenase [Nocardioides pini]MCY4726179.1 PQQ-dependent sugar dehydrogenase [Nocardioides pini]
MSFEARRDATGRVDLALFTSASTPGRRGRLEAGGGSSWRTVAELTLAAGRTLTFDDVVAAASVRGVGLRVRLDGYDGLADYVTAVQEPPAVSIDVTTDAETHSVVAETTGPVEEVRFFVDGERVAVDRTAPWRAEVPVTSGRHDLAARAYAPVESVLSRAVDVVTPVASVESDTGMTAGFRLETVQSGFDLPTSAAVVGDDLVLVAEKSGLVKAMARTSGDAEWGVPRVVLDLRDLVHDEADAGLAGIVADPDFGVNGHLYVSYVLDEGEEGAIGRSQQVVRYTWDGDRFAPGSRHVVLGSVTGAACHGPTSVRTPDCMPIWGSAHTVGDMAFDHSGNLLVGVGDSAMVFAALKDRREAAHVQDPEVLTGKVLRVDPVTGKGVPGNPMYAGDGSSNASRVLAMGFRNPFRFVVDGDHLIVGDVGEGAFEEIDVVHLDQATGRPANYGWPCLEGDRATDLGDVDDPASQWHLCARVRADGDAKVPAYAYPHTSGGGSVTAGVPLRGSRYPASFDDVFLYGDYAQNHLRTLTLPHGGTAQPGPPVADSTAAGGPVDIFEGPDGWVWQVSIYSGSLQRLTWSSGTPGAACEVGEFRRSFHDLDGPGSTFDEEHPPGPYAWLQPYADTHLPSEVLAPVTCTPTIDLPPTSGAPWATAEQPDDRSHPGDRFGVSWRGRVRLTGGTYRFSVRGSEWMRLRVDDRVLHDFYSNDFWGSARQHDVVLPEGLHVISVEYIHGDEDLAYARATWDRIGGPPTVRLDVSDTWVAADGTVRWDLEVSDPDGDDVSDLLGRSRVVAEFLHYEGEAHHVHPYRQVEGLASGTLTVDDAHASGRGVIRLWAEAADVSGATGRSAPVYVCFESGDVGPCAD